MAKRRERSLGTLGGGNHFIEIYASSDGNKYLVIHSGSRNLGKQVAEYYQNLAIDLAAGKGELFEKKAELIKTYKEQGRRTEIQAALKAMEKEWQAKVPDTPADLCYLYDNYLEDYLYDVEICQRFAKRNRERMAEIILDRCGPYDTQLHRHKGAHTPQGCNFRKERRACADPDKYEGRKRACKRKGQPRLELFRTARRRQNYVEDKG